MSARVGFIELAMVVCMGVAVFAEETEQAHSIAVLPFKNLRPDPETDWIGEGAAETLATKLAAVPQLMAVERTQLRNLLEEQDFQRLDLADAKTAVQVGKLAGSERIVVGSYVSEGDSILFNARVVDTATGAVVHAASARGPRDKVLDTLSELTEAVVASFDKNVVIVEKRPEVRDAPSSQRLALTEAQRQKIQKVGATSANAYEALARGVAAKDPDEAIRWYTEAVRLDPKYSWAYYNRGVILIGVGKNDEAIGDFDRAIALDPDLAQAYANRGIAYYQKEDVKRAIEDYSRAIALNPKYARAFYNRGLARAERGEYDEAIEDYGRAIRLNSSFAEAYSNRGNAYYGKDEYEKAIEDYDRAIALNPKYARAYYNKAVACEAAERLRDALAAYRQFVALVPVPAAEDQPLEEPPVVVLPVEPAIPPPTPEAPLTDLVKRAQERIKALEKE